MRTYVKITARHVGRLLLNRCPRWLGGCSTSRLQLSHACQAILLVRVQTPNELFKNNLRFVIFIKLSLKLKFHRIASQLRTQI